MQNIAILLTCFNRKEKTLLALHSLFNAKDSCNSEIKLSIYLTDDGSTDGTSEAVLQKYPEANILKGSGDLFWAEGMRNSWSTAIKGNYDAYFLLNDDTELYENVFKELFYTHTYCIERYGNTGIYIGGTEDKFKNTLTYSGSIIVNSFLYKLKRLIPNGQIQNCDLANANIMLVPKKVVDKIGILSSGYAHGKADYDYTLMASRTGIPVLIVPNYCGHCTYDHVNYYEDFEKKSLEERKKL